MRASQSFAMIGAAMTVHGTLGHGILGIFRGRRFLIFPRDEYGTNDPQIPQMDADL